jgi:hypothetical protein
MQGLSGALRPALETYTLNAANFLLPPTKGIECDFTPHFLQVARPSAAAQPRSDGSVARLSCFWAFSTREGFMSQASGAWPPLIRNEDVRAEIRKLLTFRDVRNAENRKIAANWNVSGTRLAKKRSGVAAEL